eukprot:g8632.t1
MASSKAVKGCLTELFQKGVERPQSIMFNSSIHHDAASERMQNSVQDVVPFDVCAELDMIFSCERSTEQTVLLFGSSPPVRSSNPLCRDSRFQRQLQNEKEVDICSTFLDV